MEGYIHLGSGSGLGPMNEGRGPGEPRSWTGLMVASWMDEDSSRLDSRPVDGRQL